MSKLEKGGTSPNAEEAFYFALERYRDEKLSKIEIAARQIDGAIWNYLSGSSRVVVATLIFPAMQIVRDLNKGNRAALSQITTDILVESGVKPGKFWQEFNRDAALFKHASEGNIDVNVKGICKDIEGAIFYTMFEYAAANNQIISHSMRSFAISFSSKSRRLKLLRKLKCRSDICLNQLRIHYSIKAIKSYVQLLIWLKSKIGSTSKQKAERIPGRKLGPS